MPNRNYHFLVEISLQAKGFFLLYFSCMLFYQQSVKTCAKDFRRFHLPLFNTHQFTPAAKGEMYIVGNDLVYLSLA